MVSFWVWRWLGKVKSSCYRTDPGICSLSVNIWIWVLPKADPETRSWIQVVYLGDGTKDRAVGRRERRRSQWKVWPWNTAALGNWGSVFRLIQLLGKKMWLYSLTLFFFGLRVSPKLSVPRLVFLSSGDLWGWPSHVRGEPMACATRRAYYSSYLRKQDLCIALYSSLNISMTTTTK